MKLLTEQEQIQKKIEDVSVLIIYQNEVLIKYKDKLDFIEEIPILFSKNTKIVAKVKYEMSYYTKIALEEYRTNLQDWLKTYETETI